MRVLEEKLGVKLLNRTTRSVGLTEAGSVLFSKVEPMLQGLSQALDEVQDFTHRVQGTLRLNVPRPGGQVILEPIINGFLAAHPEVHIDIVTDDGLIDIVDKGFDAGVRFGESVALDMIAVPMGPPRRFAVVASPHHLETFGCPQHPEDLKQHACIGRKFPSGLLYAWEFQGNGSPLAVRVSGALTLDDDELMVAAALKGAGFAYVHDRYAAAHLESGRLVRVLEAWCPVHPGFYLYYPRHRHDSAVLRIFVEWCTHYYRQTTQEERL